MQCKCIDNSSDNGNFTLGRIYRVKENVGIWQPILCRFRDWDNPGKLSELVLLWVAKIGAAMTIANEFKSRKSVTRLTEVRIGSSPIAHNMMNDDFFSLEVII